MTDYEFVGEKLRQKIKGLFEMIPKQKHVFIDEVRCNGCENCYIFCPGGCFTMENGIAKATHVEDFCQECGTCAKICPTNAITYKEPDGGTGIIRRFS
ncbi:MAG: 4Fe-4S dicluster domain-containing protein [Candidatus Helarchaeota archaeon]